MTNTVPKWNFSKPENFKDQVKLLPPPVRKALGVKMNTLAYSDYPNRLGEKKRSKYGDAFTLDIDDNYRLAYLVDFNSKIISIIRIGDHKEVYGKD